MATKRKFGSIEQLPSGKWRARYTGPDGAAHKAPITFFDSDDAAAVSYTHLTLPTSDLV